MDDCIGGIHDFEPRYDKQINEKATELALKMWPNVGDLLPEELIMLLQDEIYIGDICTRCGAMRNYRRMKCGF